MASPAEVTSEPHRDVDDDDEADLGFNLMRQSSIYSLTLDEIQNTVCEPGKNFGSMNMDEFLNNIWSVEEAASAPPPAQPPPLARQGSITVPAPLCRKTVDEVWAEIHRDGDGVRTGRDVDRQMTMGEMTLEDFLVKAGVVREGFAPNPNASVSESAAVVPVQHNYGALAGYQMPVGLEYPLPQQLGVAEGYRMAVGSPTSPVSSDGMGSGHVDNGGVGTAGAREGHGGARNGRKRIADGGVEKVVERRQRRMIKNRESAARSRARKQAYTVELEAELNLLKEDNARLREEERKAQATRKKMIADCMAELARNNAGKNARTLRRCISSPW